jgi:hypothetical protein
VYVAYLRSLFCTSVTMHLSSKDYNNRASNAISIMPAIATTSGCLHSEFVRLLFLQAHQETDRFFAASGVQLTQSTNGQFHFRRTVFSSQLKSKIGNILARRKAAALRITLNIDSTLTSSLSLGVPVPRTTQCMRDV